MNESILLPTMLMIPLLGAAGAWLLPFRNDLGLRSYTLVNTLITFLISIWAARAFDWTDTAAIQLTTAIGWADQFGLRFAFGADAVSIWLILLTTLLMPLVVLGSFSAVNTRLREYFGWLLLLEAAMLGTFIARDLIFFYICFEFTLVPLYFLIGVFGSTQRLAAARVFFLYTFTGSMLTLVGVLYVAWINAQDTGRWTFAIPQLVATARDMNLNQQTWVLLALLAGFAVKVPMWPVHTWLPLAHTEAPTAGSVLLAGVLLKLGTYGLLRFALPMAPDAVVQLAPLIGALAVVSILYAALVCWVQKDIKKLIAYSSVSHLGFCVLGLFALNGIGAAGSVMYMINHGLSTGALFLCVGMIYERFHTREMAQMSGLARPMPVWSFFMVFFCLASVGLPGLNGFVGEFLTLLGAFMSAPNVLGPEYAALAGVGMILAAIYILYMVGKVVFGPVKIPTHHTHTDDPHHAPHAVSDLNRREIATLAPLAILCLILGFFPTPMLKTLEAPVMRILHPNTPFAAADPQKHAPDTDTDTDTENTAHHQHTRHTDLLNPTRLAYK